MATYTILLLDFVWKKYNQLALGMKSNALSNYRFFFSITLNSLDEEPKHVPKFGINPVWGKNRLSLKNFYILVPTTEEEN